MALNVSTDFLWHGAELNRLLTGPDGPVAQRLAQGGIRCVNQAKLNASGRPGPNIRSGRLRSSLSWRIGVDGVGIYMDYGSGVPYAYPLETGLRNGRKYPFLRPALVAF